MQNFKFLLSLMATLFSMPAFANSNCTVEKMLKTTNGHNLVATFEEDFFNFIELHLQLTEMPGKNFSHAPANIQVYHRLNEVWWLGNDYLTLHADIKLDNGARLIANETHIQLSAKEDGKKCVLDTKMFNTGRLYFAKTYEVVTHGEKKWDFFEALTDSEFYGHEKFKEMIEVVL